jgi:hypothetical protein
MPPTARKAGTAEPTLPASARPPAARQVIGVGAGVHSAMGLSAKTGYWRRTRNGLITGGVCAAGSSVGYVFGGLVFAAIAFLVIALLGIASAVVLPALLGRRDPRSPFDRLMLIICVITGRLPRDYLPPPALATGLNDHGCSLCHNPDPPRSAG